MKILTSTVLLLALVACGADDAPESTSQTDASASAERVPTVGTEIANELNKSLEKARAVEAQVLQQKQDIDDALKEAESKPDRR